MADKALFRSYRGEMIPPSDTINEAGGTAYAFEPKHALAQYAATGCLSATFYASARTQLTRVLELCASVEPEIIAKTAVYARESGFMKDMPALLCAVLSVREPELLPSVFQRVMDNGRMVRNFVQIIRSGAVGRKSLGSRPKRLIQNWLAAQSDRDLFRYSVGADPSLADVIKMVHPRPVDPAREAFYGYLIGKEVDTILLPEVVRRYEEFKLDPTGQAPDAPFQKLTSLELTREHWTGIARRAGWHMPRMNLNTFARHGVFQDEEITGLIAQRLRNRELLEGARVFPYQLLVAHAMAGDDVPVIIREALQDALEWSVRRVPPIRGRVYILPDVSGSMAWTPATGYRKGASSVVTCRDVAALVTGAILRHNPDATVLAHDDRVYEVELNPRDSLATNTARLDAIGGGGTWLSQPLEVLNQRRARGDLVIYISDNESWLDTDTGAGTTTMAAWNVFRNRNPSARLVCLDIQPYGSSQAAEREDILNIGGFGDSVFEIIGRFAQGRLEPGHWLAEIDKVEL